MTEHQISIMIIQAKDLIAKDRSWVTQKRTTSDPYAQIIHEGRMIGKTRTVKRNCSPTWYDCVETRIETAENSLFLHLWDADVSTEDDFMGVVEIPIKQGIQWYDVLPGEPSDEEHYCRKATGKVQVEILFHDD